MHDRHRGELGLDVEVLARRRARPAATSSRERLDDVGLRRDRVGADHLRAAQRHGLGHRPGALDLPKHRPASSRCGARARARPRRRATLPSPTRRGSARGSPSATDVERDQAGQRGEARRAARRSGSGRPRCSRASSVAGTVTTRSGGSARRARRGRARRASARGVDQHVAVGAAGPRRRRPGAAASGPGRSARRARRSARAARIGRSSMRQNATTGAPVRSEPKVGNACAWRPSSKAATDSSSAAVTTPWPPRPWMRTWNISPAPARCPARWRPVWLSSSLPGVGHRGRRVRQGVSMAPGTPPSGCTTDPGRGLVRMAPRPGGEDRLMTRIRTFLARLLEARSTHLAHLRDRRAARDRRLHDLRERRGF